MSKIYFISGYGNSNDDDFKKHYEDRIFKAINDGAGFVVGDFEGIDLIAQRYLKAMMVEDVTVYHMYDEPKHNCGFKLCGGFISHEDRDSSMTRDSIADIAWVRQDDKTSCTYKNLERRKHLFSNMRSDY